MPKHVTLTDIDTDGTLTANSDSVIASQKATKAYVDNQREVLYAMDGGASAFNTTVAETTVLASAISIPANTLLSTGDRIRVRIVLEQKNNSGSAVTFTHRLKIGGQTLTGFSGYSQATNGFVPRVLIEAEAVRISTTQLMVYMKTSLTTPLNTTEQQQKTATGTLTVSDMSANATAVDFTVQMGTSNAQAEIDPTQVMVRVERI